jgi:hypothetical protein
MKGFSESITTIILLLLSFGIAGTLYSLTNGISTAKIVTVEEITAYCTNSTAYFVIRNGGTTALTRTSFVCTKTNSGCSGECVVDDVFPPGGAGYVKVYNCSAGTHKFSLTGASNPLELVVYCK